jgi:AhpD family alkylhydroperoxidase
MATPPADAMNNAPPEVRALYERALGGDPAAVRELLIEQPQLLAAFLQCYGTVGSMLDRRTYEIVYLRISMLNGCTSCVEAHKSSSQWIGLTPEHWRQLELGDYAHFDRREQTALRAAEKLTRQPQLFGPDDVAELRQVLTPEQTVDLQLLVGLANLASGTASPGSADLRGPKLRIQQNPA